MDEFRCNKCQYLLNTSFSPIPATADDEEESYTAFLTNCSHVFCILCKNQSNKCYLCQSDCTYTEINENLSPELRHLFCNLIETYKLFLQTKDFQQLQADIKRELVTNTRKRYNQLLHDEKKRFACVKRKFDIQNEIHSRCMAISDALDAQMG